MAGLLYFIPTGSFGDGVDAGLREHGLGYLCDKAATSGARWTSRGVRGFKPAGGADGLIVGPERHPRLGYHADGQDWRTIPGAACWVGLDRTHRPTPADLARPRMLAGHDVELLDGQVWHCPVARALAERDGELKYSVALPQVSTLNDDGTWATGSMDRRLAHLWPIAERAWDTLTAAMNTAAQAETGSAAVTFQMLHADAVAALAANYRVGPAEVSLLGLLSEDAAAEVLQALVDWPTLKLWLASKRTAPTTPAATEPGADPAG